MGSQQSCYDDVFAGKKQSFPLFTVNFHSSLTQDWNDISFSFCILSEQLVVYAAYHVFIMSVLARSVPRKGLRLPKVGVKQRKEGQRKGNETGPGHNRGAEFVVPRPDLTVIRGDFVVLRIVSLPRVIVFKLYFM